DGDRGARAAPAVDRRPGGRPPALPDRARGAQHEAPPVQPAARQPQRPRHQHRLRAERRRLPRHLLTGFRHRPLFCGNGVCPQMRIAMTQQDIDRRVYELYDEYCHGAIDRREFLARSAAVCAAGLLMAQALLPRYARAQTISFTDPRIKATYVTYPSPGGNSGTMRGYLVQPSGAGPFPAVLVIHENRGLNPYI